MTKSHQILEFEGFSLCIDAEHEIARNLKSISAEDFIRTREIVSDFIRVFGSIHYIDIGANFGFDSLFTTKIIREAKVKFRASAFDPGEAAPFFRETLRLNDLSHIIDFRSEAISDSSKRIDNVQDLSHI